MCRRFNSACDSRPGFLSFSTVVICTVYWQEWPPVTCATPDPRIFAQDLDGNTQDGVWLSQQFTDMAFGLKTKGKCLVKQNKAKIYLSVQIKNNLRTTVGQ